MCVQSDFESPQLLGLLLLGGSVLKKVKVDSAYCGTLEAAPERLHHCRATRERESSLP